MDYDEIMRAMRRRAQRYKWRKRLDQQAIADKLGITQPAVSKSMNHDAIRLPRLLALCEILDLEIIIREKNNDD